MREWKGKGKRMAKELPIKRPVVKLPEGRQLGLFGSKEFHRSERHAERSGKVMFNQGEVEELHIGKGYPLSSSIYYI